MQSSVQLGPRLLQLATAERWGQDVRIKNSSAHSVLPGQGAWVRTLVGEVRSHMPCGMAKKKRKKKMGQSSAWSPCTWEGLLRGGVTAGLGWLHRRGPGGRPRRVS